MRNSHRLLLPLLVTIAAGAASAQTFDQAAYRDYLRQTAGIERAGLEERFRVGDFESRAPVRFDDAYYADSIDRVYALTPFERELIGRNGFAVSERVSWPSFGDAFTEIYYRDLPVYISTDAVLHAVHMSYDAILSDLEERYIIPRLDSLLRDMHAEAGRLVSVYTMHDGMDASLADLDLYLTVARSLLVGGTVAPNDPAHRATLEAIIAAIDAASPAEVPLFGTTPRIVDFSQFVVRGHYTKSKVLGRYFRAMMWLGRTELYLESPRGVVVPAGNADVQRQTIMAALMNETIAAGRGSARLEEIDRLIRMFVGEQDNVTAPQLTSVLAEAGIARASDLVDADRWAAFRSVLRAKPFAAQRILSQILISDDPYCDTCSVVPASALMLLGQRFVIDSYILGGVIFDKVKPAAKPIRLMPSSLDALFALGNDAALQFLGPELEQYGYAPQLGAMRYLVDSYPQEFWTATIYGAWLDAIRTLNAPRERARLPRFMQTAAWWQQKMNTQLASWAQLRHDNLLYAKPTYAPGVPGCSYPEAFVEPVPEFYDAIGRLATTALDAFDVIDGKGFREEREYFNGLRSMMQRLASIARKELDHEELSSEDRSVLTSIIVKAGEGCGAQIGGWYRTLYYGEGQPGFSERDLVVADIHTAPTNEDGDPVGWVLHVGTGDLNMAVVTCTMPDGRPIAFVGPVLSYYERVTNGFERLTDEQWKEDWKTAGSMRPAFVDLYLADTNGGPRGGEPISLRTSSSGVETGRAAAAFSAIAQPNPFGTSTSIVFAVPPSLAFERATVRIHDNAGRVVRTLVDEPVPSRAIEVLWDARDDAGAAVAAGTYHYRVTLGTHEAGGTIVRLPGR